MALTKIDDFTASTSTVVDVRILRSKKNDLQAEKDRVQRLLASINDEIDNITAQIQELKNIGVN